MKEGMKCHHMRRQRIGEIKWNRPCGGGGWVSEFWRYREVEDGVGAPVLQCRQVIRARRCVLVVVRACMETMEGDDGEQHATPLMDTYQSWKNVFLFSFSEREREGVWAELLLVLLLMCVMPRPWLESLTHRGKLHASTTKKEQQERQDGQQHRSSSESISYILLPV